MGNQQVRLGNLCKVDVLGDTVYYDRQGFIYSTATGVLRKLKLIPHGGKTKKVYYRVKVLGRMWMVHHLICMGEDKRLLEKHESVNHIDGDTQNNTPENLEISTHKEQCIHATKNGLYCSGEAWYKARGYNIVDNKLQRLERNCS